MSHRNAVEPRGSPQPPAWTHALRPGTSTIWVNRGMWPQPRTAALAQPVTQFGCQKYPKRTSLVAQWLRIQLPTQETWVWSRIQEDSTCRGAATPVGHSYWAQAPQLLKPAGPCSATGEATAVRSPSTATREQPRLATAREKPSQQWKFSTAKNKYFFKKINIQREKSSEGL